MISVEEALKRIFALASTLDSQSVPIRHAAGRVLAEPVIARTDQPSFASSIMDGYAICDHATPASRYEVIGESAAGNAFKGTLNPGQAVRIFTGARVPERAQRVVIQEDVERLDHHIIVGNSPDVATYIRPVGADFAKGSRIEAPRVITASDIALFASMGVPEFLVTRRPDVAIIATGDELVQPGQQRRADQIVASNALGLAAMLEGAGACPRILPIARDSIDSLSDVFDLASNSDIVITSGGASVGDHDLVAQVSKARGAELALHGVAMRPGKPLLAGRLGQSILIGLPGNPVSSMICSRIFVLPLIDRLLGLPAGPVAQKEAFLSGELAKNGPREHYMRARLDNNTVTVFRKQDSALLGVLAAANALVVRPPNAPAACDGDLVSVVDL